MTCTRKAKEKMRDYIIVTNTTADLPEDYVEKMGLGLIYFSYTMDGTVYGEGKSLPIKDFYHKMEEGSMPTTSQVNPEEFRTYFTRFLKETNKILYLSFSSGLSGSCGNAKLIADEMMEENPEITIKVVDTVAASLGEGLVAHMAATLQQKGYSFEENIKWIEEHLQNFTHVFTVDNLNDLYRGRRVSKTTAIVGTIVNVKPILNVDMEGHLIPIDKVRGRKKSMNTLVDYMEKRLGSYRDQNEIIFIGHGDCEEDAQLVADEVKKRFGYETFLINTIGPIIGAHTGPSIVALFFLGEDR